MEALTFAKGCLCEDYPWKIVFGDKFSSCDSTACKHCVKLQPPELNRDQEWMCPRTVQASNEGGFNSTAVCLDCILEAAAGMEKK